MSQVYTGGCACGAVRYAIAGEPIFSNHCQCLTCQKISGTGHGSYLAFAGRQKVRMTGQATPWDVAGDSGNVKTHGFCPTCGSPVFLTLKAMPDIFIVPAGSLDDPSRYKPQAVTYAVRGHGWDHVDQTLTAFERMPPM